MRKAQQSIQEVAEVGGKDNGRGKRDKKRSRKEMKTSQSRAPRTRDRHKGK